MGRTCVAQRCQSIIVIDMMGPMHLISDKISRLFIIWMVALARFSSEGL